MNRLRQILKDRRGVAFPLIIAIVLVLVMLMCCISEYFRLLIVAQGVRDAVQEAVISTVNDNYDDVYHGVREGYSGAYQPLAGDFEESLDYGDIYGRLDDILGLTYVCIADFVYMQDRYGRPYGWGVAEYATPEELFGYDLITSAYQRDPQESKERILKHLQSRLPNATEMQLEKIIKG